MENSLSKYTRSFGFSLAIMSVANAVLVVFKEKSPAIQAHMKALTGHHWITHSTLVIGLFLILGVVLAPANAGQGIKCSATGLIRLLFAGVLLGVGIIVGFYLFGD